MQITPAAKNAKKSQLKLSINLKINYYQLR